MAAKPEPALVERERELCALAELVSRGRRHGGLGVIVGEAGIGKTSLLRAARARAATAGLRVLAARGTELEEALPFGVVRALLEPPLLMRAPAQRERLFADAAALARPVFATPLGTAAPALASPSSSEVDHGTLHGLYWLTCTLALERPLALVIDDAHWCDLPSLRYLSFLLRRTEGLRVLTLVALRPDGDGAAEALIDEPAATVLRPRPLSPGAVGDLVRAELGDVAGDALGGAVARASGGVPLYVHALVDEARETPDAQATLGTVGPGAVVRSVARRLAALGPEATALAEAVAVLGEGGELRDAAAVCGLELEAAARAARALAGAAILAPGREPAFVHPVVRAAVDGPSGPGGRPELHARAARALAARGADPEAVALQLLHAPVAGEPWAAGSLDTAARVALSRGAPEVAAAFLARLLAEPLEPDRRIDVLIALGTTEARAGLATATARLDAARIEAVEPRRRADATLALARICVTIGRSEDAVQALRDEAAAMAEVDPEIAAELEEELDAVGDIDLAVRHQASAGRAGVQSGRGDPSMRDIHRAVGLLMAGDDADLAAQLATGGLEQIGLGRARAGAWMVAPLGAFVLGLTDRFDAAEAWLSAALEVAQAQGAGALFAVTAANRAFLRFRRGAVREAEADAVAGLEVARLNVWPPVAQMALTPLVHIFAELGDAGAAAAAAERFGVALDTIADTTQGITLLEARGRLRIATGDLECGVADLQRAGERLRSWGVVGPAAFAWRSTCARGLARLGDRDGAVALAGEELELARRWGAPRTLGVALGAVAELQSGEQQLVTFVEAVTVLRGSGAELELGKALLRWGGALRRANLRARSRPPLQEALELAVRCGSPPLVEQARIELAAAGARPRRPLRTGVEALTASEWRIASLAASGMSNRAIAQALFVTVKTVETHLRSVYRKLGVSGRRELGVALGEPAHALSKPAPASGEPAQRFAGTSPSPPPESNRKPLHYKRLPRG
jgi:DNA-binding CsgD family transcriptional regulator